MYVQEIAALFRTARVTEPTSKVRIRGIALHTEQVTEGDLFACVRGTQTDGHTYAAEAVQRGAVALLVDTLLPVPVPQIIVRDVRRSLGRVAQAFYRDPSQAMRCIGVTGTNGKTTTTAMIEHILRMRGENVGLMGTVVTRYGDVVIPAQRTTPDAIAVHKTLATMRRASVHTVVMEVSSHALVQGRVIGVDFATAVLTNITHDHLDYHGTMEAYIQAKTLLFSRLGNDTCAVAVLNADDPVSAHILQATAADVVTYGITQEADFQAIGLERSLDGTTCTIRSPHAQAVLRLPLIGAFQVENALAAIAAVHVEGVSLEDACAALASFQPVSGRMERLAVRPPFTVIVDYAHTPDGLEHVLQELRDVTAGRLITVFGCGGDRDVTKRPKMGAVSARYSDWTIVTADNPRTESAETIAQHIIEGMSQGARVTVELDRSRAIEQALDAAVAGDVVVIAGKGHETEQWIGTTAIPCDDRAIVAAWNERHPI